MVTLTALLILLGLGVLLAGLAVTIGGRTGQILAVLAAIAGGVALVFCLIWTVTPPPGG